MKIIKKSLILGGITISILSGCNQENKVVKKKKEAIVQVTPVEQISLSRIIKTTGDVIATNTVTLRAEVEGQIDFCPWREGDIITNNNQKLIKISRPLYQSSLDVAKAEVNIKKAILKDLILGPRPEEIAVVKESIIHFESCLKFAKIDLKRLEALVKKNVSSIKDQEQANLNYVKCKTQLATAKDKLKMLQEGTKKSELAIGVAAVEKAVANLNLTQTKIDECSINSPFQGIITQVFVRPGDLIHLSSPRMPLLKIMDPSSLVIRAGLPESDAIQITKGSEVKVKLDAYKGQIFNAIIERIYPKIEANSRTRLVEVKILDTVKLLPRMFARISLQGRTVDNAIVVPDSSIITTPRGNYVVFIIKNGIAEMRNVELGIENGNKVQIVKGINIDEVVVTAGNFNLKDGTPVKIIKTTKKLL